MFKKRQPKFNTKQDKIGSYVVNKVSVLSVLLPGQYWTRYPRLYPRFPRSLAATAEGSEHADPKISTC